MIGFMGSLLLLKDGDGEKEMREFHCGEWR
jgi:hypothetical protein